MELLKRLEPQEQLGLVALGIFLLTITAIIFVVWWHDRHPT